MSRTRLLSSVTTVFLLALAVTSPAASAEAQKTSVCQAATMLDSFAEELGKYPTTFEEFADLPGELHRLAFVKLEAHEKSEFWRDRIRNFASSNDLSSQQQEFLQLLEALPKPAFYQGNDNSRHKETVHQFLVASSLLFSEPEIRSLFFGLGNAATADSIDQLESWLAPSQLDLPLNKGGVQCDCEYGGDPNECGGWGVTCVEWNNKPAACYPPGNGCGALGMEDCDGQCCLRLNGKLYC